MDAALWSGLPFEMVEQVLSFVPVPNLCRYRSVCKRWNRLICNPDFGALCVQNAAKRGASFIIMHYTHVLDLEDPFDGFEGWSFLDLNARRWYSVKHSAGHEPAGRDRSNSAPVLAMDGGLACHCFATEPDSESIVVYNPIAKTSKELPTMPPDHLTSESPPELILVADCIAQSFTIFFINREFGNMVLEDPDASEEERLEILSDPLMYVYDSATQEWRSLSNPSWINCGIGDVTGSVIFLRGLMYVLITISNSQDNELWRYNLVGDAWENVAVNIPRGIGCAELIVSADRLFLVGWRGRYKLLKFRRFEVSEIKIPEMTRETLFVWTEEQVMEAFQIEVVPRVCIQICVAGFGSSLMFMSSSSGISMAFDVVTRSWDREWPRNPLGHLLDEDATWIGKQMDLILPCTRW